MESEIQILKVISLTNSLLLATSSSEFSIEVIEFDDENLVFQMPKPLGRGLLVSMEIQLRVDGQWLSMEATGKISSCQALPNSAQTVKVELHDHDSEIWSKFMDSRKKKQDRVAFLLQTMKGDS